MMTLINTLLIKLFGTTLTQKFTDGVLTAALNKLTQNNLTVDEAIAIIKNPDKTTTTTIRGLTTDEAAALVEDTLLKPTVPVKFTRLALILLVGYVGYLANDVVDTVETYLEPIIAAVEAQKEASIPTPTNDIKSIPEPQEPILPIVIEPLILTDVIKINMIAVVLQENYCITKDCTVTKVVETPSTYAVTYEDTGSTLKIVLDRPLPGVDN